MENPNSLVTAINTEFATFPGRVSAIASSTNKLFVGNAQGDIFLQDKLEAKNLTKIWKQDEGAIEGLMYDFEGKVIYATERNLVVLNSSIDAIQKEFRTSRNLSTFFVIFRNDPFGRKKNDSDFGPPLSMVVGRTRAPHKGFLGDF